MSTESDSQGMALDLPGQRQDASQARRFLGSVLPPLGWEERVDDACLLVSELLANVVLHARTSCRVAVQAEPGRLEIAVSDDSPALPRPRNYAADAATGRGLKLLAALSDAWGADPDGAGKRVWFRFDGPGDAPGQLAESRPEAASDLDPDDLDGILAQLGAPEEDYDSPASRPIGGLVCAW